jgi:2-keto-3-deoxy-6-phosphogluconate aldolase
MKHDRSTATTDHEVMRMIRAGSTFSVSPLLAKSVVDATNPVEETYILHSTIGYR